MNAANSISTEYMLVFVSSISIAMGFPETESHAKKTEDFICDFFFFVKQTFAYRKPNKCVHNNKQKPGRFVQRFSE